MEWEGRGLVGYVSIGRLWIEHWQHYPCAKKNEISKIYFKHFCCFAVRTNRQSPRLQGDFMPPVDVAIVTLLTDNTFLPGVQCLLYSLRDNDRFSLKIPKIVLVTSAVSKVTRKQITRIDPKNVSVVEVEAIPNPHAAGERSVRASRKARVMNPGEVATEATYITTEFLKFLRSVYYLVCGPAVASLGLRVTANPPNSFCSLILLFLLLLH